MRMYDYLNNITKSIDNQATAQESKSSRKFKIENNLLVKLEYYIKHYKTKNKNIYDVNIQDEIIQKTLHSCFGDLESQQDYNNIEDYVNSYQLKDERIDEDYYYLFCMKNYLKCCRNVENFIKKSNELTSKDDYKKQIALEKWELQKQIMEQKLQDTNNKEAEKQRQEAFRMRQIKQQQRQAAINTAIEIIGKMLVFTAKATIYIIVLPLKIAALFLGGFVGGMVKMK